MKFKEDDILDLYLSGGGINPASIKASEVADLISAYENALFRVIEKNSPEINTETILISLIDVQEGSSHYKFVTNYKEIVFAAALAINTAIATNSLSSLPFKTVKSLEEIWKFTKKRNCQAEFIGESLPKAVIVPEVPIQITEDFYFEGESTIYGKVERVGGATPRVRIKLDSGQILFLEINEKIAKELANRLYEGVALKGLAKWRKDDYGIEDFSIESIQNFEEGKLSDSMKELRETVGVYWDKIGNIDEYILNSRYEKDDY